MADNIAALLDDILIKVHENPQSSVPAIVNKLTQLIEAIPIAAKLGAIQQWNLLQGLLYEQSEILFFQRMEEQKDLKQQLATYCLKQCGLRNEADRFRMGEPPTIRSVFLESGSTIAHLIGKFAELVHTAQRERGEQNRVAGSNSVSCGGTPLQMELVVNTNNLTALTALAGMIRDIEPTQGWLSFKYFGFLPFANDDKDSDWSKEGRRFITLSGDIASSDLVFATCSSFSLVMGPLVGSRANSITKRAMYCGVEAWGEDVKRTFYLLFHINKYVTFASQRPGEVDFDPPEQHCSVVFMRPNERTRKAIKEWPNDYSSSDNRPRVYKASWHERAINDDDVVQEPIKRFDDKTKTRVLIPNELTTTWLDWCERLVRRKVRILIALPNVHQIATWSRDFLVSEVKEVNVLLEKGKFAFRYIVVNEATATDDRVVEIEVRQGAT